MAKYGISGVIGGGSAEGGAVERHMLGFQAAYARRGIKLELGERLPSMLLGHCNVRRYLTSHENYYVVERPNRPAR